MWLRNNYVGLDNYISDMTSVILPNYPPNMTFPLTAEETSISLKISLLRLSSRVLKVVLREFYNYFVVSKDLKLICRFYGLDSGE